MRQRFRSLMIWYDRVENYKKMLATFNVILQLQTMKYGNPRVHWWHWVSFCKHNWIGPKRKQSSIHCRFNVICQIYHTTTMFVSYSTRCVRSTVNHRCDLTQHTIHPRSEHVLSLNLRIKCIITGMLADSLCERQYFNTSLQLDYALNITDQKQKYTYMYLNLRFTITTLTSWFLR